MSDLISRKAILKNIKNTRQGAQMMDDIRRASIIMNGMDLCEEAVRNQPSAQSERKKGKWIDKSGGIEGAWNYCSVCGEQAIDLYDFCPNCGADMRGENDD